MKLYELMDLLKDLPEDTEVRFAHQPSWPFELSISEVVMTGESDDDEGQDSPPVVYLVEGQQLGYLPGEVSSAIGWR
jgi:hypothetical protein